MEQLIAYFNKSFAVYDCSMTNSLIPYPQIDTSQLTLVDEALKRIDLNCKIGLYSELIRSALELALYDQNKDSQNVGPDLWDDELRSLNNLLKRLRDEPPTQKRLHAHIADLHEVTRHFLNARLKMSSDTGKGLAELDLGLPQDLDDLTHAISSTRAVHRDKPGGGHHASLHEVTNSIRQVYQMISGKKPTLTSNTSAEHLPRQMNSYEELLLESIKVIEPHLTLNGARNLDRAATGKRLKVLQ